MTSNRPVTGVFAIVGDNSTSSGMACAGKEIQSKATSPLTICMTIMGGRWMRKFRLVITWVLRLGNSNSAETEKVAEWV